MRNILSNRTAKRYEWTIWWTKLKDQNMIVANLSKMKKHLAIMSEEVIEAVLNGTKTIETRLSHRKIPPYRKISKGDLVYMKPPGEELVGQFRVKKVFSYEELSQGDVKQLFEQYKDKIGWGDMEGLNRFIKQKANCPYATLIFIADSERFLTPPIKIKKSDLRGWVVLE